MNLSIYILCHQSGLRDDGRSLGRKDRHHTHHTHVASGDQKRPTCPSTAGVLAKEVDEKNFMLALKNACTSLSAFSVFNASIAAISRIDSSTFPCSPGLDALIVAH